MASVSVSPVVRPPIVRALFAVAPFAIAAPLLEASRLAGSEAAIPFGEALASLRPELLTSAGVALLAVAGAYALRRVPRLYIACLQLVGLGGAAIEFAAHTFLHSSGRGLDWDLFRYAVSRPTETWPVVSSELSSATLAAALAVVIAALIAPWLVRSGASTTRSRASWLAVAGAACLALSLWPGAPRANGTPARNAVAQLVYTAWRAEPRVEGATVAARPAGPARVERVATAPLPNVAIIALESTSAGATSIYDSAVDSTPFLARLARRSLVAERAYAVIPHTSKSIVSILCGFEPRPSVDVVESRKGGLPGKCLPQLLAEHGYATAFFQSATQHFERRATLVENMGFALFRSGDQLDSKGFEESNYFGFEDAILLEPSRAWLRENGARPFLAMYMTNAPHHDYRAPRRYGHRKLARDPVKNRYLNSVRYVDFFVRDLVQQYQDLGLYENTVFVIVGDHGEAFDEHGLQLHDDVMYDEGVRVPFLVHDPRPAGRVGLMPGTASLLDVVPTALALAGFRGTAGEYSGHSLLDPLPDRFVPAACYRRFQCLAGIRGAEKFIYYYGNQPDELFDLDEDPHELNNLAATDPLRVARWQADLVNWRESVHAMYEPRGAVQVAADDAILEEPEHRADVRFGNLLELTGFDGPRWRGDRIEITYHFHALGRVPSGYELVLRGSASGHQRSFPYVPSRGASPLAGLEAGQRIVDVHELRLPKRWRTQAFDLCIGLAHTEAGPVLAHGENVDGHCAFVARIEPPGFAAAAQATQ